MTEAATGTMPTGTTPTAAIPAGADVEPRVALTLALADDELVIGHRHAQWTGVAPHLEEDLAFSSIAQDEIGHAVVWYRLAAATSGGDPDALAFGRTPSAYRNAVLVERDTRDWAYTIARQWVYDTAEDVRLQTIAASSWADLAAATGPLLREERYHLQHARLWLVRLADGGPGARQRLTRALGEVLDDACGLFETLPGEQRLLDDGTLARSHAEQWRTWLDGAHRELEPLGLAHLLPPPDLTGGGTGGRQGRHSDVFPALWETLTGTYRAHPTARW